MFPPHQRPSHTHTHKTTGKIIICVSWSVCFWIARWNTQQSAPQAFPDFNLLLISSWMEFWFVMVVPKIIWTVPHFKEFIFVNNNNNNNTRKQCYVTLCGQNKSEKLRHQHKAIIMQNKSDKTCPNPITLTLLNIFNCFNASGKDYVYSASLPHSLRPRSLLRTAIGSVRP
jgi:hypothetical protein